MSDNNLYEKENKGRINTGFRMRLAWGKVILGIGDMWSLELRYGKTLAFVCGGGFTGVYYLI